MAVQKRKAVTTASSIFKSKKSACRDVEAEEEEEEQQQPTAECEDEQMEDVSEPVVPDEADVNDTRKKELKAKPVDAIKALITSAGLPMGKKEDMVDAIVQHEAKTRADAAAKAAEIRAVVVAKKEELEALSLPELATLCKNIGISGMMVKPARVEKLLTQWMEKDGVDKALAKKALDAREQELASMDTICLHKLCEKAGADPFVKEVMVDRILRTEATAGHFSPPKLEQVEDESQPTNKSDDVVANLIASEALRKKEKEQKKQQEDDEADKRKELKSKSVDELKKLLSAKGIDATGKKDEMVEALFHAKAQEDALAARRASLKSMPTEELSKLVFSKGLEASKKDDMVEALLSNEAKLRKEYEAYQAKIPDVLKIIHEELEAKTGAELKDLCAEKSLKLGLDKTDRIQTLLHDAKDSGEVDKRLSFQCRQQRQETLFAMEKISLKNLCDELAVDAFVNQVMIERLLCRETELGCPTELEEPARKKARTSKR